VVHRWCDPVDAFGNAAPPAIGRGMRQGDE
jgi:hypothetical protein